MNESVITGFFALGGAALGAVATIGAASVERQWDRARKDIVRLCDEVAAFYELEQLYKRDMSLIDPDKRHERTILESMRARVSKSGQFVRPSITSNEAEKIRRRWS